MERIEEKIKTTLGELGYAYEHVGDGVASVYITLGRETRHKEVKDEIDKYATNHCECTVSLHEYSDVEDDDKENGIYLTFEELEV